MGLGGAQCRTAFRDDQFGTRQHKAVGHKEMVGTGNTYRIAALHFDCHPFSGAVLARETGLEWAAIWAVKESGLRNGQMDSDLSFWTHGQRRVHPLFWTTATKPAAG